MLKLSDAGAVIMPASPSFYSSPASIEDLVDTIIARILNHLNIDHQIIPQWGD
jgi:4-hydroxy-3-polyprenylbenzoate decarboxylase